MQRYLMRLPEVQRLTGLSRSSIYSHAASGLLPKPVKIGARSIAWPSDELSAVINARRAGRDDDGIRLLVIGLERARVGDRAVGEPS